MDDDDFDCSFGDDDFGISNTTLNSTAVGESCESSFEVENEGLLDTDRTSTPRKKAQAKSTFKVPKPPPAKYFARCTACGQYLKTERGFKTHSDTHKWKDAAALKPPIQDVLQCCHDKVTEILDSVITQYTVQEGEPAHLLSVEIVTVLKDVKGQVRDSQYVKCMIDQISEIMHSKSATKTMLSSLRSEMQSALSRVFSCKEFRADILQKFFLLTTCKESLAWNVIFIIMKKMLDQAFIFMCEKMRGPALQTLRKQSKDDFDHYLSHQTVHHVAGSCLRAHFRNAYRYPNNSFMRNVKECILVKFAKIGGPSIVDRKNPQYWTSLMNRKSLLFVKPEALPFFIELSKMLQKLEASDGSVHHNKVMDELVATPTMVTLWDCVVDNFLSEDESFKFMEKVVKSLTNTFGKGVMIRRMNARVRSGKGNKATLAVSHRARLIGKL